MALSGWRFAAAAAVLLSAGFSVYAHTGSALGFWIGLLLVILLASWFLFRKYLPNEPIATHLVLTGAIGGLASCIFLVFSGHRLGSLVPVSVVAMLFGLWHLSRISRVIWKSGAMVSLREARGVKALWDWRLAAAAAVLLSAGFFVHAHAGSDLGFWIGLLLILLVASWRLAREYLPNEPAAIHLKLTGAVGGMAICAYFLFAEHHLWFSYVSLFTAALLLVALRLGLLHVPRINHAVWRPDTMALLGRKLGLSFQPNDTFDIARRYGVFFRALACGEEPVVNGVLHGTLAGREVYVFDCGGISAVLVPGDYGFKPVSICPERLSAKVSESDRIEFESAEFTSRFRVTAQDRRYAYSVVTPRIMELLLAHPRFSIELAGNAVLVHSGELWTFERCREAMEVAIEFAGRIATVVQKEFSAPLGPADTQVPAGGEIL